MSTGFHPRSMLSPIPSGYGGPHVPLSINLPAECFLPIFPRPDSNRGVFSLRKKFRWSGVSRRRIFPILHTVGSIPPFSFSLFNGTHISPDDTFPFPLFVPLGSRISSDHTGIGRVCPSSPPLSPPSLSSSSLLWTARLVWVFITFLCFHPGGLEDRKEQG